MNFATTYTPIGDLFIFSDSWHIKIVELSKQNTNCLPLLHNTMKEVGCVISFVSQLVYELVHEKTNNLGSIQVQHIPGCTVTEDG